MATTTARPRGTGNGAGNGAAWWGGGGGGDASRRPPVLQNGSLGMLLALAGISMLFIAITSSYVVGQGSGFRWTAAPMPRLVPLNTLMLLISSATMERSRRAVGNRSRDRWLAVTLLLGMAFLTGQVAVWQELASRGLYLGSNPHSSFFYLLTGLHGLHLLGGIVAVGCLKLRAWRDAELFPARWTDATALYWHFMGGLWAYLVVLLFAWR